jgi:hypothetical protein
METNEKELNNQPAPAENEGVNKPVAPQEIDFKSELEKAKELLAKKEKQLGQAEHTIVSLKKKKDDDDGFSSEVLDDDIKEEVRGVIKEELNSFKTELTQKDIESEIQKMTSNLDEQALIKHHYQNSINKTGLDKESIEIDLLNARALANRNNLVRENRELKEALKANKTVSGGIGSSAAKAFQETGYPDNLSDRDIAFLKRRGITPEKYNKLSNK